MFVYRPFRFPSSQFPARPKACSQARFMAELCFNSFNYDKFVSRIFDERITPENMHNKVCKMALGIHSKASNHAVKGELGRSPLHLILLIIYTRIFKYFLRLLTLQNNQILNSALEINIHLNNVGKHSWFTIVRHLLHFTKLSDYTPNLPHLDYRTFRNSSPG